MNNSEKTTTISMFGELCELKFNQTPSGTRRLTRSMVFVSNPYAPEDIQFRNIRAQPPVMYKGEDAENDREWKKYNQAEKALEALIIDRAVEVGFLEKEMAQGLQFSKKAGCQCGCSPGWKSKDTYGYDIWITLVSPSMEAKQKQDLQDFQSQMETKTLASMVI